jgi:bacteriorhodopsin
VYPVNDLRQITWMSSQWKRFRRLIWGATSAVWLLCSSGILLLGEEDFLVRMALLAMFALSTFAAIYLLLVARRESKKLERLAIETRARLQEEKAQKAQAGK